MPGVTGSELLRVLESQEPRLPVLLVSGYASRLTEDRIQASPYVSTLTKPFSKTQLLGSVREALARADQQRERAIER